jgi:hypothetical protein
LCALGSGSDVGSIDDARRVVGPEDHLRHYQDPSRARAAVTAVHARASSVGASVRSLWPARGAHLGTLLDAVTRANLDVWLADRTLPEVFGDGWHVARALVPGAVELSWGQAYRRLASPRVERWLRVGRTLGTLPHPLA